MAKLTRTQRAVLNHLVDGWVMDPAGKDSRAAVLFNKPGDEMRVSAATVEFLLGAGYIRVGDIYFPYTLTPKGREAIKPERPRFQRRIGG